MIFTANGSLYMRAKVFVFAMTSRFCVILYKPGLEGEEKTKSAD